MITQKFKIFQIPQVYDPEEGKKNAAGTGKELIVVS